MKKIMFAILILSTFILMGTEREGKGGKIIGNGRLFADSLISRSDTSLVFNMNLTQGLIEVTVIDTGTGLTDSVKVYSGLVRYNGNGTALDTTWSHALLLAKLNTGVRDTIAIGAGVTSTYFVNAPLVQLLKVSSVNAQAVTGKRTGIIISTSSGDKSPFNGDPTISISTTGLATEAKLDSLLNNSRASAILTVNGDTTNGTGAADAISCIGTFTHGYSFTITADDTIEVSSTAAFTAGTVFPLRPNATSTVWSYTSPYLKATSFPTIYYRRKGASGIPLVDFIAWGN